jgi:hypothetical protein
MGNINLSAALFETAHVATHEEIALQASWTDA